jgi:hypothetical protein
MKMREKIKIKIVIFIGNLVILSSVNRSLVGIRNQ